MILVAFVTVFMHKLQSHPLPPSLDTSYSQYSESLCER